MSYWIGSPAFGVAVDAGEVEVVVCEEREHVVGEVGRRLPVIRLPEAGAAQCARARRAGAIQGLIRVKVSAISALTVSPQRHRCGLYVHFHFVNISRVEVAIFLRGLLRHVRGRLIVLWDGNTIHAGPEVEAVLSRHPRLQVERLPTYAPELNPDELVWNHLKARLANASFDTGD